MEADAGVWEVRPAFVLFGRGSEDGYRSQDGDDKGEGAGEMHVGWLVVGGVLEVGLCFVKVYVLGG